jgi:hypothetical protein
MIFRRFALPVLCRFFAGTHRELKDTIGALIIDHPGLIAA